MNEPVLKMMTEKEIFIEILIKRTRKLAVDIILFCNSLKTGKASSVVTYQFVKSATSTGANEITKIMTKASIASYGKNK
jgi:hypothetical protein